MTAVLYTLAAVVLALVVITTTALPSGVSWRCRCGIRWRLDDDIWTQLAPKGRP